MRGRFRGGRAASSSKAAWCTRLGPSMPLIRDDKGLRVTSHPPSSDVSMGFDEGRPVFYAAAADGLHVSEGGEEWRKTSLAANVRAVAACRTRAGRLHLAAQSRGLWGGPHCRRRPHLGAGMAGNAREVAQGGRRLGDRALRAGLGRAPSGDGGRAHRPRQRLGHRPRPHALHERRRQDVVRRLHQAPRRRS